MRNAERQRLDSFVMLANQAGRIGIWELDLQTNVSTWDRNMYALYGVDDLTIVPTAEMWLATLHPDDRPAAAQKVTIDIARGVPSDTEFRIVWPNGEIHYIRSLVTIVRDANGKPMRIIGTDWDVTELRSLAAQLREEKELLVASESRYRALTEAMPQMVVGNRRRRIVRIRELAVVRIYGPVIAAEPARRFSRRHPSAGCTDLARQAHA